MSAFKSLEGAHHAIVHLYNATAPLFRRVVFGMPVGTRVVRLGEPMLDAMLAADLVDAVDAQASGPAFPVARQVGKLDAIVRQDGVQVVGHRFEQGFQECDSGRSVSLLVELGERELRRAIDADVEVELASSVRTSAMSMWK